MPAMQDKLSQEIMLEETKALHALADQRLRGPDRTIVELFKILWPTIGTDYLNMIRGAIAVGSLLESLTAAIIILLHKGGSRELLSNWRMIILLNVMYKILAKTLQLRLQAIFMEIINSDQFAFLLMRFILDNILLTQETIYFAKFSLQPLLFFKLDFAKAYDKVDLDFLFSAMAKRGLLDEFKFLIRLLSSRAKACININGRNTKKFEIG